jgi:4-pyridoxolactonase
MDMNCISIFHLDSTTSLKSMHRLKQLAEKHNAVLFYSPDPESFPNYVKVPGFYS